VRLALISDQHGNDVAFAVAVDDIERIGVDQIVCLGDVAEGGVQPAETLDRLRALDCPTVLGNTDAFLLEVPEDSPEHTTELQLEVREWTLDQLEERHLDFIRGFAPTVKLELGDKKILCFHGSPASYDDVLIPEGQEASLTPFQGFGVDLLAGGHTHTQWTRRIDGALFVNPGSVGLAYDHHQPDDDRKFSLAEYALVIVDDLGLSVEFRRVPYSAVDVKTAAASSGRPYANEWGDQWATD
jgi:putative phosphoesterase